MPSPARDAGGGGSSTPKSAPATSGRTAGRAGESAQPQPSTAGVVESSRNADVFPSLEQDSASRRSAAGSGRAPASVPRAVALSNPIDEAPEAVWYVRPPSGGQYGPARGDVLRKWLAEGRVSVDTLLWREGWADWQVAGPLFPELGGDLGLAGPLGATSAAGPQPSSQSPVLPGLPSQPNGSVLARRPRRKISRTVAIAMIVMLAIVSLVLLGVLVVVLNSGT